MSLAGIWRNDYGSTMKLRLADSNLVVGTYNSSTGSSGTYRVIGYQTNADPTPQAGQPVCLAIEWHSVVAGPPDNSWHWVSGLSGQISIQKGVQQLVLSHSLVASVEYPGFAPAGTYIDKLVYSRIGDVSDEEDALPDIDACATADNPLVGSWFADDGTALLINSVSPDYDNAFAWIVGKMTWHGGPSMIYGVTDINAIPAGLKQQSVSIVGLPSDDGGPAISLSGTLDLSSGALTLLNLHSSSTPPANSYLQTQVSSLQFSKR